jgi:1,5-anhydro-D-fructose reductase (1,5-anhydro-D-mannitol-forming)
MVARGRIGEIEVIQVEGGSGPRHYDNWRADPAMAGLGTLYNVGVHMLDFLRWILDSEATEVTALFDHPPGSGEIEMLAMVLLRFGNGTMAYLNANERLLFPQNDIAIHGKRGRIIGAGVTRSRADGELRFLTDEGETVTPYLNEGAHQRSVAAFTRAVLAGETPNASGVDGLRSIELCDAIARSARERRTVGVDYVVAPGQ